MKKMNVKLSAFARLAGYRLTSVEGQGESNKLFLFAMAKPLTNFNDVSQTQTVFGGFCMVFFVP
jgi:hypothetical protein